MQTMLALRETIRSIARSPITASILGVLAVTVGIIALLRNTLAGAIILAATILAGTAIALYAFIIRDRFGGLYEFDSEDHLWDIQDAEGRKAVVKKSRRIRFLQDEVFAIRDYAWGDGNVLAAFSCDPGHVADTYSSDGRHSIVITLRETKRRGDEEDFHTARTVENTFTGESEWVQAEILHNTKRVSITVLFPKDRPPTRAWIGRRSKGDRGRKAISIEYDSDGRGRISQLVRRPKRHELYTVGWTW